MFLDPIFWKPGYIDFKSAGFLFFFQNIKKTMSMRLRSQVSAGGEDMKVFIPTGEGIILIPENVSRDQFLAIIKAAINLKQERWGFPLTRHHCLFFLQIFIRGLIMANPQKENGYTPIANDIMDALCKIRIPGEERQCLDFILRKTYGWGKIKDKISLSQFQQATDINKQNVCRALSNLLSKKIIIIIKKDKGITEYSLQKDFEKWEPLSKKITLSKKIKGFIKNDKGVSQQENGKSIENDEVSEVPGNYLYNTRIIKNETYKNNNITKETITKVIGEKQKKIENKIPPPLELVIMYFQEKGYKEEHGKNEGEAFFDHFTTVGWLVGKARTPMKNWQSAIRNWIRNNERWNRNKPIDYQKNTKLVSPKMSEEEKDQRYNKPDDTARLLKEIEEKERKTMEDKNGR